MDPMLDAMHRATDARAAFVDPPEAPNHYAYRGAKEMVKPIREEYAVLRSCADDLMADGSPQESAYGAGIRHVLEVLAPLIYSAEELS